MTETTALVRLSDIVGAETDPLAAYRQVYLGLADGTITTTLPRWKSVACMQEAIEANSPQWYARMKAYEGHPEKFSEARLLRDMFLDARMLLLLGTDGVPDALEAMKILTEKARTASLYGNGCGLGVDEALELYLSSGVNFVGPQVQDQLRELQTYAPSAYGLAHRVATMQTTRTVQ